MSASNPSLAARSAAIQDHLMRSVFGSGPRKPVAKITDVVQHNPDSIELQHAYLKGLTRAQRWGLVERPSAPPCAERWRELTDIARKRAATSSMCPICHEKFQDRPQILLSCSHVFHRQCFESFERFAPVRCCPMCRQSEYYKCEFTGGTEQWKESAVIDIQRCCRGWLVRRAIVQVVRSLVQPEEGARPVFRLDVSPALLMAWEAQKVTVRLKRRARRLHFYWLQCRTELLRRARLRCRMRDTAPGQLGFGVDGDYTVECADQARKSFTDMFKAFAATHPRARDTREFAALVEASDSEAEGEWSKARRVAAARLARDGDCPICCESMVHDGSMCGGECSVALLSCTHAFHSACIFSFEAFKVFEVPKCPVCRSCYDKSTLHPTQIERDALLQQLARDREARLCQRSVPPLPAIAPKGKVILTKTVTTGARLVPKTVSGRERSAKRK